MPAVASAAAVDAFPLTTLLALRQREEEAAEAEWVAAVAALRAAEARLAGLRDEVEAARGRWEAARGEALSGETLAAWDVAARQRFLTRRRDEWTAATAAEASFRAGALAEATGREAAARAAHADKHRGREVVEKQKEQWLAETRRQDERRAEDARDDLTAATRHRRSREP